MLGDYELLVFKDHYNVAPYVMLRVAMTWNPNELSNIFKPWESRYAKTRSIPFQVDCSNVKNYESWLVNSRTSDAFYFCARSLEKYEIQRFFSKGLVTHHWISFCSNNKSKLTTIKVMDYMNKFLSNQVSEEDFKEFFLNHLDSFSPIAKISGNKYNPKSNPKLKCRGCNILIDFVKFIRSIAHRFNPEHAEAQRLGLLADILCLSQSHDSRFIEYGM